MLPTTKWLLWKALQREGGGIEKHAYCTKCNRHLGLVHRLGKHVICRCGFSSKRHRLKYFIVLSIEKQLRRLFKDATFREGLLQYRNRRRKIVDGALEDILDGEAYGVLQLGPYDFTYVFNMDGFKIFKSGRNEALPIFLRINELPINLRQKYVILAGLWVDVGEVNFNLFMENFIDQANALSTTGIVWKPDSIHEVISKIYPTVCCADAKGRAGIINMGTYAANCSCPFCNHIGIKLDGAMKFPLPGTLVTRIRVRRGEEYEEQTVIPPPVRRTGASVRNAMMQADELGRRVEGIHGLSQLILLEHFNFGNGFSTDDLHPIFKGVTEFHTELIFMGLENEYDALTPAQINRINQRLERIKTPTHISRKPRAVTERAKWKGTEWRNWLLYCAIPCLHDIISDHILRHLGLLSRAVFILTRDIITDEDLQDADHCLRQYVALFQERYIPQNMRFNIHILEHVVAAVRFWGPLWAHSTCQFESWNHRLAKTVKSPNGAIDQMSFRYLMNAIVNSVDTDETISDAVKEVVKLIKKGPPLPNALPVAGAVVFGKSAYRVPHGQEVQLLADAGHECHIMEDFEQVKVNGCEVRSAKYRAEGRSTNNVIYTYSDEFYSVNSIVVFGDRQNFTCGMFVTKFDVGDCLLGVPHIVPVQNHVINDFIPIPSVRNTVVITPITNELSYISPMANNCEIG